MTKNTKTKYIISFLFILFTSLPLSALDYEVEHPCDGMLGKIELTGLGNYDIAEVNWYTVDVVTNGESVDF